MAFADEYLQKSALLDKQIVAQASIDTKCIVAIPAYNESRITRCLDSLFNCDPAGVNIEVLVLINSGRNTPANIRQNNLHAEESCQSWCSSNYRPDLNFHILNIKNLPDKHHGAGLARKLVMDEAVRRFNQNDQAEGLILSLDADTRVAKNYFTEVLNLFNRNKELNGCSIYFEHPLEGREFPDAVYDAIVNYELHMRYYLQATRSTAYKYAYHTLGSAFAVKAETYCLQGGMSKRQAGEDFYFIQKVASLGKFGDCCTTTVFPSPRPSDRVPFGTGPAITKQLNTPGKLFYTYDPELFIMLSAFYKLAPSLFGIKDLHIKLKELKPLLRSYLQESNFEKDLDEIFTNSASEDKFILRFHRKFSMFWILKFLHYAENHGYPKIEITSATQLFLNHIGQEINTVNKRKLLEVFRELDKASAVI